MTGERQTNCQLCRARLKFLAQLWSGPSCEANENNSNCTQTRAIYNVEILDRQLYKALGISLVINLHEREEEKNLSGFQEGKY